MRVDFGVLGPVAAWSGAHDPVALRGPRHRAVLARLIVARTRMVPLDVLIDDLWPVPPENAAASIRTFVADLRRALEPDRPPRTPAKLLVTEGPGYALRTGRDTVDAWRFEDAVTAAVKSAPAIAAEQLDRALTWWRGPAYADFPDEPWTRPDRTRLNELRSQAVEGLAEARLELGQAAAVLGDLDTHTAEHPWRENAWRLLALALYRDGRQAEALAVLRRARAMLADQLGLDPGPELARLEEGILRHDSGLRPLAGHVWSAATTAFDRALAADARLRLESTVGILRGLAVTGGEGLQTAREHRLAAVAAAEQLGDPELTARVIGAYDVPAVWSRVDDPDQAARIVSAARRTLVALPADAPVGPRARLLATIAVESRGVREPQPAESAQESVALARDLQDPGVLVFALNGLFMQSFGRCGLAPVRDGIGAELIEVSARHGLPTYEVLGHLVRLQARSALGDLPGAARYADAADALADRHDLPLVGVFTTWFRALRQAADDPDEAEHAYRSAAATLTDAGMPGLSVGLLPLALLCVRVTHGRPIGDLDGWGPYAPWAYPHVLLGQEEPDRARAALRGLPDPPADHVQEALWCLAGRAAIAVRDEELMRRAYAALLPAAGEIAGAGTGLFGFGPIGAELNALVAAVAAIG
ncbi:BTAD domain-containing putative transcriptional regulator [Hamadaea sp. NPDC051192]|uniref:BTAD domain-containing putative transcriptional regulator n=1 Tax=Hamadaea sp. NPDC051192 TaxID=3154940 RepID=UPI00342F958B